MTQTLDTPVCAGHCSSTVALKYRPLFLYDHQDVREWMHLSMPRVRREHQVQFYHTYLHSTTVEKVFPVPSQDPMQRRDQALWKEINKHTVTRNVCCL